MNTVPIHKENPERVIHLHKRDGAWVIDVTVKALHRTVEVHKETNYQRAEGVFWFLYENPPLMIKEATRLIQQEHFDRHGEFITIEEELARR